MNTQLPTTFADQLQEKLQKTVGDMIPPEAFKALSEAAINKYIKETLPKQVDAELKEFFHELIQAELHKPEWLAMCDEYGKQATSEMVKNIIVQKMVVGMSQMIVSQMICSMPRPY